MDAKQFDELVARLATGPSRRDTRKGLVGGAMTAAGLSTEASSKGKGAARSGSSRRKGRRKRRRADAEHKGSARYRTFPEACTPENRLCDCTSAKQRRPRRRRRGRRRRSRGWQRCRPCTTCCHQHFVEDPVTGDRRCSCRPTGTECRNSSQCCSGICNTTTDLCEDYGDTTGP